MPCRPYNPVFLIRSQEEVFVVCELRFPQEAEPGLWAHLTDGFLGGRGLTPKGSLWGRGWPPLNKAAPEGGGRRTRVAGWCPAVPGNTQLPVNQEEGTICGIGPELDTVPSWEAGLWWKGVLGAHCLPCSPQESTVPSELQTHWPHGTLGFHIYPFSPSPQPG